MRVLDLICLRRWWDVVVKGVDFVNDFIYLLYIVEIGDDIVVKLGYVVVKVVLECYEWFILF